MIICIKLGNMQVNVTQIIKNLMSHLGKNSKYKNNKYLKNLLATRTIPQVI